MYRFSALLSQDLHVNELRLALISYICAKQANDMLIVRIEDSNKVKGAEEKDHETLQILQACGIKYDTLYYQSNNFKYHLQFASSLMDKGLAFACFCSPTLLEAKETKAKKEGKLYSYDGTCINISRQELLNNNKPFTIRIKRPKQSISFNDTLGGEMTFSPEEVDSFIIMNQAKYPTHNFGCACDDMLQGVSFIIAQEKDILEIPRQELIRKSLGYNETLRYAHLPNLEEDYSVKSLLEQGFLPEAIVNYLLSLGNNTPQEIFSLNDAVSWFSLQNITSEAFDINKLTALNKVYIQAMDELKLSSLVGYSSNDIGKLAKLYLQEVGTIALLKEKIDAIFSQKNSEEYEQELATLKSLIRKAPYMETFEEFQAYLMEQSGLIEETFLHVIRILLTGKQNGPKLEDLYNLIKNYLGEIAR